MLDFTVIILFPPMFASPLGHSILKKAQEKRLISVRLVNPRDYTTDKHRTTDDSPYGGGQGMVMREKRGHSEFLGLTSGFRPIANSDG